MDIVKLYRQTVASKKLGTGTSVTKQRYVAGKSGRIALRGIRLHNTSEFMPDSNGITRVKLVSTGISRQNRADLMRKHGTDRPQSLVGQQFRTVWKQAKDAQTSVVLGPYSAAKQREAHYA